MHFNVMETMSVYKLKLNPILLKPDIILIVAFSSFTFHNKKYS